MNVLETLRQNYPQIPVTSVEGKRIDVDWASMNDETIAALAWHGLKQKANDPNGAKGLTDGEKVGNSRKVIDKAEANELNVRERESDPVAVELTKLVNAKAKAKKIKDPATYKEYVAKLRAMPELQALAERNVAALAEIPDIE